MSSFQGVRGGVGYNDPSFDADSQRRQQLAQLMLRQSESGPAIGATGALNKILSGAIAGYQMGMDGQEQQARGDARTATLADALRAGQGQAAETKSYGDGTTINWNERKGDPNQMAAILAGNKDTAGMGMQMQLGMMDEKRKNEAATAAALLKRQNDREDEFYKPIKTDDGSIIVPAMQPGFQMPGQAPRAPAPRAPSPQAAPQDGPVATAPPVPLTPTSGSGPMGPNSNNPGNIRASDGNAWQGKNTQPGAQFESFDTPESGVRAMSVLLGNYAKQGVNTLGGIVNRWAPPNENQTSALVANAAKRTGLDPNQPLDLSDPAVRAKVVQALIVQEQGKMPYGQDVVQAGVSASMGGGAQPPAQSPPQGGRVQVADASGATPASALSPGTLYQGKGKAVRTLSADEVQQNGLPKGTIAQIDPTGRIHVVNKGEGDAGGGMFPEKNNEGVALNTIRRMQGKISRGEKLSGDEQYDLDMATQYINRPKTIMTDQGVGIAPSMTIPTRNAPGATDTVPNPVQPAAAPVQSAAAPTQQATPPQPASPPQQQDGIRIIQPKAAKPIPEGIQKGMTENVVALRKIEDAAAALSKTPEATGAGVGAVNSVAPNAVTNFMFPEGVNARALISDIGSLKIHDRSGAAVSVSEFPRLAPFIPTVGDSGPVLKDKLANFQREYINALNDMNSEYGADKGYSANSTVTETLKNGRTPRYQAPNSGEDPNQPKSAHSGLSDADLLKQLGM